VILKKVQSYSWGEGWEWFENKIEAIIIYLDASDQISLYNFKHVIHYKLQWAPHPASQSKLCSPPPRPHQKLKAASRFLHDPPLSQVCALNHPLQIDRDRSIEQRYRDPFVSLSQARNQGHQVEYGAFEEGGDRETLIAKNRKWRWTYFSADFLNPKTQEGGKEAESRLQTEL